MCSGVSKSRALDRPILYRTTQWEMDEAGERTLTLDFRARLELLTGDAPEA